MYCCSPHWGSDPFPSADREWIRHRAMMLTLFSSSGLMSIRSPRGSICISRVDEVLDREAFVTS